MIFQNPIENKSTQDYSIYTFIGILADLINGASAIRQMPP